MLLVYPSPTHFCWMLQHAPLQLSKSGGMHHPAARCDTAQKFHSLLFTAPSAQSALPLTPPLLSVERVADTENGRSAALPALLEYRKRQQGKNLDGR